MTNTSTAPLFAISGLRCAYKNGRDVLTVDHLEIPSKKLVILLGKSGSGKSTLLESLGLMNNTLKQGEITYFPSGTGAGIPYSQLWTKKVNKRISQVRHDNFSFIFQNTNLMPNFTAYENASLTSLIRGHSLTGASEKIGHLMNELGLQEISETRKASEMSGGQKQRLAFIRAIASDFDILFGDEPTGNLDDINSRELITFLSNNIKRNDRSAIIVTHNIPLSIEFGDIIILISPKSDGSGINEIIPGNIYLRNDRQSTWSNHVKQGLTGSEMAETIAGIISQH